MGESFKEYVTRWRREEGSTPEAIGYRDSYTVAGLLLQARLRAGLTQNAVSERCGVDQADISRYERGLLMPSLPTVLRLLDALGARLAVEFDAGASDVGEPGEHAAPPGRRARRAALPKGPATSVPIQPRTNERSGGRTAHTPTTQRATDTTFLSADIVTAVETPANKPKRS